MHRGGRWTWGAALLAAAAGDPAPAQDGGPVPTHLPPALTQQGTPASSYRMVGPPPALSPSLPPGPMPPLDPLPPNDLPAGQAAAALPPLAPPGPCPPPQPSSRWERCLYRLQRCFLGFPEEFREPPLGYSVYAHYRTHVVNAEVARMALHEYDFLEGS